MTLQTYLLELLDDDGSLAAGMPPNQIKAAILMRGLTVSGLAAEFGVSTVRLSQAINRHRVYPTLRLRLAEKLGRPLTEVFGQQQPRRPPSEVQ